MSFSFSFSFFFRYWYGYIILGGSDSSSCVWFNLGKESIYHRSRSAVGAEGGEGGEI